MAIEGQRFGLVVVLRKVASEHPVHNTQWVVRCDCGVERIVTGCHLKHYPPKSHVTCKRWMRRARGLE